MIGIGIAATIEWEAVLKYYGIKKGLNLKVINK